MRVIAPGGGLTNNHALFINSHGKGVKTRHGVRYVFYPHEDVGAREFFIEDIAAAVGADNVPKIHNLIISACNTDSSFSAKEVRKCFPNATNIIHSAAGQAGYQEMVFQVLLADSSQIETLYQSRAADDDDFEIGNRPLPGCKKCRLTSLRSFAPAKSSLTANKKPGANCSPKSRSQSNSGDAAELGGVGGASLCRASAVVRWLNGVSPTNVVSALELLRGARPV